MRESMCGVPVPFISLTLIWKFQNVPSALGFEVEHSKIFCKSFRRCIII